MAAVSPELFESELFGHVRGSFTGATVDRKGHFEMADRGTIFLDEIGDLRLDHQSKLLRVLQDKSFHRVGASRPTAVDVRVGEGDRVAVSDTALDVRDAPGHALDHLVFGDAEDGALFTGDVVIGRGTIDSDNPRLTRRLQWNHSTTPWTRVVLDGDGHAGLGVLGQRLGNRSLQWERSASGPCSRECGLVHLVTNGGKTPLVIRRVCRPHRRAGRFEHRLSGS